MTSRPSKISFGVLPVEIENTIWSYLDSHEKYPHTRLLNWPDRRNVPELKKSKLAIRENEKNLLVNFARAIYNTFLNDDLNTKMYHNKPGDNQQDIQLPSACKDRDILPTYMTSYDRHLHPICNEISGIIKTVLFDDIKMVNGKPIVRKNIYKINYR